MSITVLRYWQFTTPIPLIQAIKYQQHACQNKKIVYIQWIMLIMKDHHF